MPPLVKRKTSSGVRANSTCPAVEREVEMTLTYAIAVLEHRVAESAARICAHAVEQMMKLAARQRREFLGALANFLTRERQEDIS